MNDSFLSTETIPVLGIDLGTTFCCVGTWRNGKVEIIVNEEGGRTTPSVVSFKKYQIVLGKNAKNLMITNSKNTIYDSKRLIGRRFEDSTIQEDMKNWDFKIEKDYESGKPEYVVDFNNKEIRYYPEEISGMILKKIKSFSSDFIGSIAEKAVITVPAHFTNGQREATKKAAELAGLKVIRIINEPTASAIGYLHTIQNEIKKESQIQNKEEFEKERTILVFDLGGGTFDVSIVKYKNKSFEVLASCGDNHLGGEDFTERLTDYVINCFKEDEGYENLNFKDKNNPKLFQKYLKLKNKVEEIKIDLSFQKSVELIYDDYFYDKKELKMNILRSDFEQQCNDLFERCVDKINQVIEQAKLKKEDINDIVLSGGSSRIPKIQEMIKNYFQKDIKKIIDPDEAIAYGATIVACIENDAELNDNELKKIKEIKIIDITPFSIGIETAGEKMEVIIQKGTLLPDLGKEKLFRKIFVPEKDYAKSYTVKIYEGEDEDVNKNYLLGMFKVLIEHPDLRDKIIVKILMNLDHHSIITIRASTNEEKKAEIISSEIYRKEILERFNEHLKDYENVENENKQIEKQKKKYNDLIIKINEYMINNNIDDSNLRGKLKEFKRFERQVKEPGINEYSKINEELSQLYEIVKNIKK